MGGSRSEISVDEAVNLLKRTGLPTVLVEGSDDMIVYRRLEEKLGHLCVSVLPLGGRTKVLEVFERRKELPPTAKIAFVVDRDTWIHTGVPIEFVDSRIVLTAGYSIENDVFIDGDLTKFLTGPERVHFDRDMVKFVDWYALAVSRKLGGAADQISLHPKNVLDPAQYVLLTALTVGETYPATLRDEILANYKKLLRGKSLMAVLVYRTNRKGRVPHHSERALLESVAVNPGPLIDRIWKEIEGVVG